MNLHVTSVSHAEKPGEVANALEDTGYVVLRGAISNEDLTLAHQWIRGATETDKPVADALQPVYEANGQVRKIRRLAFHDTEFWLPWIHRSNIARLASELLGDRCTLILHASFKKPARVGSPVVPHQDQALWETPYPGAVTAWVALEDATPENGCLEMYPGSHKRGEIPHEINRTEDWHEAIDVQAQGLTPQPVPMRAGDVILWHRYMAHSSGPNLSERDRMAMVMVFADAGDPDFKAYDRLAI